MKYIDTNVFIYALHKQSARDILFQLASGKLEGATSCLTWDEFVWTLRKDLGRDEVLSLSRKLIRFPHLIFLNVTSEVMERAHQLVEQYNIKPRDALHAAAMLENGISEMISSDPDFDRIYKIKRIPIE